MKFRKKPVIIDAFRFDGTKENAYDILNWAGPKSGMEHRYTSKLDHTNILVIQTLEGEMRAVKNDWIIKGVNGEFYPCKPDIFEKTYEKV